MDPAKVEQFMDRFVGFASGATTIGLLAIADRTGLTQWLGTNSAATALEIASGVSLDLRYVEEICGGLTAAGVLTHDDGVFALPPEHAQFLTEESSPYFMAGWLDMIPAMMSRVDDLADATRNGGGVGFAEFGDDLVRGLDRANRPSQKILLTRKWLPAVPGLVEQLEAGIRVADIGCGSGAVASTIAAKYPNSEVFGFDVSEPLLDIARERSTGINNVTFERRSVAELTGSFDLVTSFDVIHDLSDPLAGLQAIRAAIGVNGQFLMMEPNVSSDLDENINDTAALFFGVSAMFCMTQSLAAGGAGLGAAWGHQRAEALARQAGFGGFERLDSIENRFSSFYLLTA